MFTGLVSDMGAVERLQPRQGGARLTLRPRQLATDALAHHRRRLAARRAREPRARARARRAARRPPRAGARRRGGRGARAHRGGAGRAALHLAPRVHRAARRREGLDRGGRGLAHRRDGGPRSLRGGAHPRDARPHHARRGAAGDAGEPRGGRRRAPRRAPARVLGPPGALGRRPRAVGLRRNAVKDHAKHAVERVERALDWIRQGRMVILTDDEDRENEGDLCLAAEKVTPAAINFMAKYGRGLICVSLTEEKVRKLRLPLMVDEGANTSSFGTAFTVSIEAKEGVTTGISARDRAHTILTAVRDAARPEDLARPGHVFPLRARKGGVLVRAGQTEGSVDLARLAGLKPAGVICEVMNDDGTMAR